VEVLAKTYVYQKQTRCYYFLNKISHHTPKSKVSYLERKIAEKYCISKDSPRSNQIQTVYYSKCWWNAAKYKDTVSYSVIYPLPIICTQVD